MIISFHLPLKISPLHDWPVNSVFLLPVDSQRSHLSSFTMKLMDKFHSPKIKRIPSKKGKQLQPEPAAKSTEKPANKVCVCVCLCVQSSTRSICVYCGKSNSFPPCSVCLFDCLWGDCFPVSCSVLSHSIVSECVQVSLLVPTPSQSLWYSRCLNLCRHEWFWSASWMNSSAPS